MDSVQAGAEHRRAATDAPRLRALRHSPELALWHAGYDSKGSWAGDRAAAAAARGLAGPSGSGKAPTWEAPNDSARRSFGSRLRVATMATALLPSSSCWQSH
eukprot:1268110-Prymnesium_polylepis.1